MPFPLLFPPLLPLSPSFHGSFPFRVDLFHIMPVPYAFFSPLEELVAAPTQCRAFPRPDASFSLGGGGVFFCALLPTHPICWSCLLFPHKSLIAFSCRFLVRHFFFLYLFLARIHVVKVSTSGSRTLLIVRIAPPPFPKVRREGLLRIVLELFSWSNPSWSLFS